METGCAFLRLKHSNIFWLLLRINTEWEGLKDWKKMNQSPTTVTEVWATWTGLSFNYNDIVVPMDISCPYISEGLAL